MKIMDKDLISIQEARDAVRKASAAQKKMAGFTQEQIDRIVFAMVEAGYAAADSLAKIAVEETKMGRYEDKIIKNQFGTRNLWDYIKDMKTIGVVEHDEKNKLYKIATPMGVVSAIIPVTNPTSTAMYKTIISVKSGNGVAVAPHPKAAQCTMAAVQIIRKAAESAGAPEGLIQCIEHPAMEGTQALMKCPETSVILATGGWGIVREAYSSGKPAYGVGAGNVPAFIEKTADVKKAVADIIAGKCFDYGVLCTSEQALIADVTLKDQVIRELRNNHTYICSEDEKKKLERYMFPCGKLNASVVGQAGRVIAERSGFTVPPDTTALVVPCSKVGYEEPLSAEKLSPVLALYFVNSWEEGCELSMKILNFGGIGHTMSIHSSDYNIIMKFAMEKPAFRIVVNTVSTLGGVGYTTGVAPSMTLGPGTLGGAITTDNITPLHLINYKRLAFEIRPFTSAYVRGMDSLADSGQTTVSTGKRFGSSGISDNDIERIVSDFLKTRK